MATDGDEESTEPATQSEIADAKTYLRRLAGADGAAVVERADAATADLDAAVAFVEEVGLDRLERAVAVANDPEVVARGERALAAFRRFRAAAAGEPVDEAPTVEHFHPGPGTDLRAGDEAPTE